LIWRVNLEVILLVVRSKTTGLWSFERCHECKSREVNLFVQSFSAFVWKRGSIRAEDDKTQIYIFGLRTISFQMVKYWLNDNHWVIHKWRHVILDIFNPILQSAWSLVTRKQVIRSVVAISLTPSPDQGASIVNGRTPRTLLLIY